MHTGWGGHHMYVHLLVTDRFQLSSAVTTYAPDCLAVSHCSLLLAHAEVAVKREVEGDLLLHDMGQGLGFQPGAFDGAIRYSDPLCYIVPHKVVYVCFM